MDRVIPYIKRLTREIYEGNHSVQTSVSLDVLCVLAIENESRNTSRKLMFEFTQNAQPWLPG